MTNSTAGQTGSTHDNRLPGEAGEAGGGFDGKWLLGALRRNALLVGAGLSAGLAYGAHSVYNSVPHYTARSVVLMNGPNVRAINDLYTNELANSAALDSEIELIRSDRIARAAVLRLAKANVQQEPPKRSAPSLLDQIQTSMLGVFRSLQSDRAKADNLDEGDAGSEGQEASAPASEEARQQKLAGEISSGLTVRRVRQTLLVEITYTGTDREYAAQAANAYADAYIGEQRTAKTEAAQSAGHWLEAQAAELRRKVQEAELAVRKFKVDHRLTAASDAPANDARAAEVNRQLVEVRAELTRLQAKRDHIKQIVANRETGAVFSEVLNNPIIEQLRTKYLDVSKREADVSRLYGAKHAHAVRLRQEKDECERFIFAELVRVADSHQNELDIARARETALNADIEKATGKALADSATLSELNDLTHRAELYQVQLKNVMQRYEETVQQQSLPNIEARVVSVAAPPATPDEAGRFRTLLMSMMIGALGLGGAGVAREMLDRSFRTGDQIRSALGMPFFGAAPRMSPNGQRRVNWLRRLLPGSSRVRLAAASAAVMGYVIQNPHSNFAEALRAIRLAIVKRPSEARGRVLGVVSTLPGEGKTATAKNLASFLAGKGVKTLLIDGDLRNPGLSRAVAGDASRGLIEAVREGAALEDVLIVEPETQLAILPALRPAGTLDSAEFLASPEMNAFLVKAREQYDQVIIDLPPMNAVIDVRAAEHVIDDFLLVVEWGKTHRSAVTHALDLEKEIRAKCIGALLNKVDVDVMRSHERSHSREYYHRHYGAYYSNNAR